jgi:hypothetical protein
MRLHDYQAGPFQDVLVDGRHEVSQREHVLSYTVPDLAEAPEGFTDLANCVNAEPLFGVAPGFLLARPVKMRLHPEGYLLTFRFTEQTVVGWNQVLERGATGKYQRTEVRRYPAVQMADLFPGVEGLEL